MDKNINVYGIQTNNLKNIDITIKRNKLNLIIGPSGSGKSSLAYSTIAQIGLHEFYSMFKDDLDEPDYKVLGFDNMGVTVPIKQTNYNNNIKSTIGTYFSLQTKICTVFANILKVDYKLFSLFNEENVCENCYGLGYIEKPDLTKIVNYNKAIKDNPFRCWYRYGDFYIKILKKFCADEGIDIEKTMDKLPNKDKEKLLYGESINKYRIGYKSGNSVSSRTTKYYGLLTGIPMLKNFKMQRKYFGKTTCNCCNGMKFSKERLRYKICGVSIGDILNTPFTDIEKVLKSFISNSPNERISVLINEILSFINKAIELNLGYLTLNRSIPTLSGGELQRLRLVHVFNNALNNLILILDEPLVGVSGEEKEIIFRNILKQIPKHTVILVDHSDVFYDFSENIIALGYGGGKNGGNIINYKRYIESQKIPTNKKEKKITKTIIINSKTKIYQYKGVNMTFAEKSLNLISGKSGVGKTTLLKEYLSREFDDYIYISQKPIVGNANSNVATLLNVANSVFAMFSKEFCKEKGFFSNQSGKNGACSLCMGSGYLQYGTTKLVCGECNGTGFNKILKKYHINKKSLFDIWKMTIDEAVLFLGEIDNKIKKSLMSAQKINLGYLSLGQSTVSLSGGENIRIKMLKLENTTANILGIDEPFKGLNPSEILVIIKYMEELINKGKTVLVADHTDIVSSFFDYHVVVTLQDNIICAE